MTSMDLEDDQTGTTHSIPVVVISNDDFDEDQEQIAEEKIPITEDLIFMKYETEDIVGEEDDLEVEKRIGYVFYFPEMQVCKVLECVSKESASQQQELKEFETWICRVLYVINEQKSIRDFRIVSMIAEQNKRCSAYCILTDLDVLLAQSSISDIFRADSQAHVESQRIFSDQEEESKVPASQLTLTQKK